jgi:hypothetical protein
MLFSKAKTITLTMAACVSAANLSVLLAQQPAAAKGSRSPAVAEQEEKPNEKVPRSAKLDLTPESFPNIHALVRPHDHEWRHLQVHWLTDVVAARKKAATEDKPIVVIHTGGAGYNEPLGIC